MLKQLLEPFRQQKIDLSEAERVTDERAKPKVRNWKKTVRQIFSYLLAEKWMLLLVTVMVALSSGFAILGPYMMERQSMSTLLSRRCQGLTQICFFGYFSSI